MTRLICFLGLLINFLFVSNAFALTAKEAHEALPYAFLSYVVYDRGDSGTITVTLPDESKWVSYIDGSIGINTDDDAFDWGEGCTKFWSIFQNSSDCLLSGFYARLFRSKDGSQYVLAFRGTEITKGSIPDILMDLQQFIFGPENTAQYNQALGSASSVLSRAGITKDNLVVTGHSLGGGMAAYAAAMLGVKAYIFNPARLGGVSSYNGTPLIKSYISQDKNSTQRDWISWVKWPLTNLYAEEPFFVPVNISGVIPLELHSIGKLANGLHEIATSYSEPPPYSDVEEKLTATPLAGQEPVYSTPGGEPMLQRVYNLNPSDTVTLYIENEESGEKFRPVRLAIF